MAALPSPAVALLAMLGVAGALPMPPAASQGLRPNDRLHHAAVKALAPGKLLVAARRLPIRTSATPSSCSPTSPATARWASSSIAQRHHGGAGVPAPDADDGDRRPGVPRRTGREDPADGAAARGRVSGGGAPRPRRRLPADGARGDRVCGRVSSAPGRLRVYLGYSGWGPGQLEAETAEGVWHVLAGDVDAVFDPDPSSTWQRQIARTEVIQAE